MSTRAKGSAWSLLQILFAGIATACLVALMASYLFLGLTGKGGVPGIPEPPALLGGGLGATALYWFLRGLNRLDRPSVKAHAVTARAVTESPSETGEAPAVGEGELLPDGVFLVRAAGDLSARQAPRLLALLEQAIAQRSSRIAVDLGAVETLGDASVGALLRAQRRAHEAGGDVRLSAVPDAVRELLDELGLDRIFAVFETEAEAVDSFASEGGV